MSVDSPETMRATGADPMHGAPRVALPAELLPLEPRQAFMSHLRDVAITFVVLVAMLLLFIGPDAFQIHQPMPYSGDGLSHGFLIKTVIDAGWYPIHTPWVGAPFGSDLFDYPIGDGLHIFLIRLLSLFSGDWVVISNLFFIAGYFLSAGTACVVLRRFGLASPWAIAGAVLFALLPYRFLRRGHLMLVSYFAVPLGVYLAVLAGTPRETSGTGLRPGWRSMAVCVVVGSSGIYYAFFSAFLIAVAGAIRILASRSWRPGVFACGLVATIAITALANVAPSLIFSATHGRNPELTARTPAESEIYGLRITQMILPHKLHRLGIARSMANRYAVAAPLINENTTASLGVVGTVGLALLLVVAIGRAGGAQFGPSRVALLAALGVAALLLGTIGGLGSVFAYTVTPLIRGYNRISVVIAFIALATLLLMLQAWAGNLRQRYARVASIAAAATLVVVGAFDQTPGGYVVGDDPLFARDRAFFATVEAELAPGSMVYQLPYHAFPEAGHVHVMEDYGLLRGYLNTSRLRWSYGAMKGRPADQWFRTVSTLPLPQQLSVAAQSGFAAVYLDRHAYVDGGKAIDAILTSELGNPFATSRDGALSVWRIHPTGDTPPPLEALLPPITTPIEFDKPDISNIVKDVSGFSGWEAWGRWTEGPVARIRFARALPQRFTLKIDITGSMPPNAGPDIVVRAGSAEQRFRVGAGPTSVELPMALTTPADTIELRIPAPTSPRELGMSEDPRRLGIGIRAVTVLPGLERTR